MSQSTAEHTEHSETRARLLEAAERLFAERGFEATSVRDITTEAGCNVAAVNYHFGGKDSLYLETFRNLLGELRDRRIRRIRADMDAAGADASLELFLESMANAFLEPLVVDGRGRLLTAMVSRELMDHRLPANVFLGEFVQPVLEVAVEQLAKVGPRLDPLTANMCLMSLIGQLLHVRKSLSGGISGGERRDAARRAEQQFAAIEEEMLGGDLVFRHFPTALADDVHRVSPDRCRLIMDIRSPERPRKSRIRENKMMAAGCNNRPFVAE